MTQVLSYEIRGAGPGLVLIHGTSSSGLEGWLPIVDQLAAEHTVVLPNLPGSGDSPLPGGRLDIDMVADQIVTTARAAGLERFGLAGMSLGAPVAIKAAARHPDSVSSLATVAGYARPRAALRLSLELWEGMRHRGDSDLGKLLIMLSSSEEYLNGLSEEALQQYMQFAVSQAAPGTAAQIDLALHVDVLADLDKIQAPTLIVAPRADRFVFPDHSRELAVGIRSARLAEIDGGHAAIYEYPQQILDAFREFFNHQR